MRLVEVEEEEEGAVLHRPLPGERGVGRLAARALGEAERVVEVDRDAGVVDVEAVAHPGVGAQHVGRDGGAGRVARAAQHRRQVGEPGAVVLVADVVAHSVLGGEAAGEHRQVRREGQRRVAVGPLEEDGVLPEGVEGRRLHPPVAVGRQVVRAQGVDRDQDHRGFGKGPHRAAGLTALAAGR